ncbi:gastrula zinc finger protein XlCGF7.1-like [Chrysoperla carnea]|uniref:gastrula zinc finger protein XlCGF7.1-like n=1 Tax=Chrysoperla carnea TaxID=189513 RepID=UPI001D06A3FD|nr:gastrula zinc finger protein XlCGF7.1-like [Chrysoperla carnea]
MQTVTKSETRSDTCEDIKDDENVELFTCEKCNKEYKKVWVLGQHMHRKHKAKALKCNKCELKFYHPLHLKEHQDLTHNPQNLTCNTCKKVLVNIYELKRHKFRTHSLHCKYCDKPFKDKCSLKNHIKEEHLRIEKYVTCHICGKSITKKNIHHHLATHGEREKITCDKCSKTFINDLTFKAHMKEIHGERIRKHLCNICGHASRSAADLRKHIRTHSDERPYSCDRCDKTFRCADNVKRHISSVHLNERKYQCTFCPQAFCAKSTWVHHERLHTGENPHKCEVCGKAFAQKIALTVHMKTHNNSRENRTQNLDDSYVIMLDNKSA